jgi:hypothetical protein
MASKSKARTMNTDGRGGGGGASKSVKVKEKKTTKADSDSDSDSVGQQCNVLGCYNNGSILCPNGGRGMSCLSYSCSDHAEAGGYCRNCSRAALTLYGEKIGHATTTAAATVVNNDEKYSLLVVELRENLKKARAAIEKKWHATIIEEAHAKLNVAASKGLSRCKFVVPTRPTPGDPSDDCDDCEEDDEEWARNGIAAVEKKLGVRCDKWDYDSDEPEIVVTLRMPAVV